MNILARKINLFKLGGLSRAFKVLNRKDQRKTIYFGVVQSLMSLMDLFGVVALGILGSLTFSGVQSKNSSQRIQSLLEFIGISSWKFQNQALFFAAAAIFLLVGRSLLSIYFTRRVLFFMSKKSAEISRDTISKMLSQPNRYMKKRTNQQKLFDVTNGIDHITIHILAISTVLVSDISVLLVMALGLLVVDPQTAIGAFAIFATISFGIHRYLSEKASKIGVKSAELEVETNESILEVFNSIREITVRSRKGFYVDKIFKVKSEMAEVYAERYFMPYISKYIIESAMIIGAMCLGAYQFITVDAERAIGALTIFLAAGSRIAPAILRIQQSFLQVKGSLGHAETTLSLIEELREFPVITLAIPEFSQKHKNFASDICLHEVSFGYEDKNKMILDKVSIEINQGEFVAVLGSSGAGKSTLVDLVLGLLTPQSGEISISGLSPKEAIAKWPGAIAYIPQEIFITNSNIRGNVSMGFKENEISDVVVENAITQSQLGAWLEEQQHGINESVGENGHNISGGQRQRLGIARALVTNPSLLVMDEATSALDLTTEAALIEELEKLKVGRTIVLVAHRQTSLLKADKFLVVHGGKVSTLNSYSDLCRDFPKYSIKTK